MARHTARVLHFTSWYALHGMHYMVALHGIALTLHPMRCPYGRAVGGVATHVSRRVTHAVHKRSQGTGSGVKGFRGSGL